jgi:hypothetical protein
MDCWARWRSSWCLTSVELMGWLSASRVARLTCLRVGVRGATRTRTARTAVCGLHSETPRRGTGGQTNIDRRALDESVGSESSARRVNLATAGRSRAWVCRAVHEHGLPAPRGADEAPVSGAGVTHHVGLDRWPSGRFGRDPVAEPTQAVCRSSCVCSRRRVLPCDTAGDSSRAADHR